MQKSEGNIVKNKNNAVMNRDNVEKNINKVNNQGASFVTQSSHSGLKQ